MAKRGASTSLGVFSFILYVLQVLFCFFVIGVCSWDKIAYQSSIYDGLFAVHVLLLLLASCSLFLLHCIEKRRVSDLYKSASYIAIYPMLNLLVSMLVIVGILPGFFESIRNTFYAMLLITQGVDVWKLYIDLRASMNRP